MSRIIVVAACGFLLAACSMSMPSMDFFKSKPATEALRIESEPPGADARTSQGQTCKTPCDLNVPTGEEAGEELAVTVAMAGYQPQTLPVRREGNGADSLFQPNPVHVELEPAAPVKPAKPAPLPKKKANSAAAKPPALAPPKTQAAAPAPASSYELSSGYPWPPAPQ